MNRLLHIVESEVKKVKVKQEELFRFEDLQIFVNFGRNGQDDRRLITTVHLPKRLYELWKGSLDNEKRHY